MMLGGGRSVEGNRSRSGKNTPSKFLSGRGEEGGRRQAQGESQSQTDQDQIQISKTEVTPWPGSSQE